MKRFVSVIALSTVLVAGVTVPASAVEQPAAPAAAAPVPTLGEAALGAEALGMGLSLFWEHVLHKKEPFDYSFAFIGTLLGMGLGLVGLGDAAMRQDPNAAGTAAAGVFLPPALSSGYVKYCDVTEKCKASIV